MIDVRKCEGWGMVGVGKVVGGFFMFLLFDGCVGGGGWIVWEM